MNSDSQSGIHLVNHQSYHEKTKHIDICLHFIGDMINLKEIEVQKAPSEENSTYIFTEPFARSRFKYCFTLIKFVKE